MIHAICVAGTRPNLVKIKPVIVALEQHEIRTTFVHTGQHYDRQMSGHFLTDLDLRPPDIWLGIGSGSHAEQTSRVMLAFEGVLSQVRADVVVVVGDVNSTLGCSLAAAKVGTIVAHVEAGLRSRDWSMPEEVNRVIVDRVSDDLFAPSSDAVDNLRSEGYRDDQIHLVGNVMVDSLVQNLDRALQGDVLERLGLEHRRYVLTTLHRPDNVDQPKTFRSLMTLLGDLARDIPVIFPIHPRTEKQLAQTPVPRGVSIIEPCGYLDFLALEHSAALVLTDSGGVQEETTALGVPCLTLRETTERPITVVEGTNQVVGRDYSYALSISHNILKHGRPKRRPLLWDGFAANRIAAVLATKGATRTLRPSSRAASR